VTEDKKDYIMKDVPTMFVGKDINSILLYAEKIGASDIHIQGGTAIIVDIHSRFHAITARKLSNNEVDSFIKQVYAETAVSRINGGEAIDTSHSIKNMKTKERLRYRINAIGVQKSGEDTIQITIRTIPSKPIKLSELGIEDEIWENFTPDQGIVVVTGPTGSGKSTLLASCVRELVETPNINKKIVTYEAPIEFTYDYFNNPSCFITQTEVGRHLKTWNQAIESAMRRKPDIILIGEARDPETISSAVEASQTGHLVLTTSHTNGVPETIRRMINVFPSNERSSRQVDLIDSMRMVVSQRLLLSLDGKRVAIREWLIFDEEVKESLFKCEPDKVSVELRRIVNQRGTSLSDDAIRKYDLGLISKEVCFQSVKSYGGNVSANKFIERCLEKESVNE
jgi:defect-in-organelle-trafficking protein DotB